MKKYLSIIKSSQIFSGIDEKEIESMLGCLGAKIVSYSKGEFILRVGEGVDSVGFMLEGTAHVIQEDYWGNRNLITQVNPRQLFAEAFACSQGAVLNVSVVSNTPCSVMFLNIRQILTTCPTACAFHSRLIRNLLSELAEKNLRFNEKLTHMSQCSTREKLLSYLSSEARKRSSPEFDIPFNRQQLADYLSVDRSAMSSQLCKLRDEGVLSFDKNHFVLLNE